MRYSISRCFNKSKSGFTLIEILVVVAIIGILTAFVTLNFSDARKKARDQARKSDLQSLQLAIETYKIQNGEYPAQGCGTAGSHWAGPGPHDSWARTCDEYILGLTPNYIAALPKDPTQEYELNKGYIYRTNADRSAYKLIVYRSVESQFVTSLADEFARCPVRCDWETTSVLIRSDEYAVYSVGAEGW